MAVTYEAIQTTTLGGTSSSVTLSSIPSTYTDLILVYDGQYSGDAGLYLRFNGDTGSYYSGTYMQGDGSSASSARNASNTFMNVGYSSPNQRMNAIIQIFNYSNSTTYKTVLTRQNTPSVFTFAQVGLYRNTPAAIDSLTLYPSSGSFASGSTFTLYGIKAA